MLNHLFGTADPSAAAKSQCKWACEAHPAGGQPAHSSESQPVKWDAVGILGEWHRIWDRDAAQPWRAALDGSLGRAFRGSAHLWNIAVEVWYFFHGERLLADGEPGVLA